MEVLEATKPSLTAHEAGRRPEPPLNWAGDPEKKEPTPAYETGVPALRWQSGCG